MKSKNSKIVVTIVCNIVTFRSLKHIHKYTFRIVQILFIETLLRCSNVVMPHPPISSRFYLH